MSQSINTQTGLKSWQRLARRLLLVVFIVLLTFELAQLAWTVIAPTPLYLKEPTKAKGSMSPNSTSAPSIAQAHLFGELGKEPVKVVKQVEAPETRLKLELHGINLASSESDSSAIIARKGAAGEFYRIGDTVQGRTTLSAVYADRVILETSGKLETLKFEETRSTGISSRRSVSSSSRKDTQSSVSRRADSRMSQQTSEMLRDRFRRIRSPEDFLNVANQAAAESPETLLNGLGLKTAGSGNGYRVESGSVLLQAGLRVGDSVISVNGQSLGDASSDQQLLEQVLSEGRASIVVQRGDKRLTLNQNFGKR